MPTSCLQRPLGHRSRRGRSPRNLRDVALQLAERCSRRRRQFVARVRVIACMPSHCDEAEAWSPQTPLPIRGQGDTYTPSHTRPLVVSFN